MERERHKKALRRVELLSGTQFPILCSHSSGTESQRQKWPTELPRLLASPSPKRRPWPRWLQRLLPRFRAAKQLGDVANVQGLVSQALGSEWWRRNARRSRSCICLIVHLGSCRGVGPSLTFFNARIFAGEEEKAFTFFCRLVIRK